MNVPIVRQRSNRPDPSDAMHLPTQPTATLAQFTKLWQRLSKLMTPNHDPVIQQRIDRHSRTVLWHVYDPLSGQSMSFGSELEVRLWLEHRHYH